MKKSSELATDRTVRYVADSFTTLEGDGVPIRRAIPSRTIRLEDVDPMLLLDDFQAEADPDPDGPGFPRHPHRGFEIITYLLSGRGADVDDEGNVQKFEGGGLQKITAGAGMEHGGAPRERSDEPIRGLQIWINLAKKDKKLAPEYQVVSPNEIPEVKKDGVVARVLVGEGSPTRLHTPTLFLDVKMAAKKEFEWDIPEEFQGYIYLLEGEALFGPDGKLAKNTQMVILGDGERLKVRTSKLGVRFLLAAGQPHKEPIRWYGPFVD